MPKQKKPQITAYISLTPDMKKRFRGKLRNYRLRIKEIPLSPKTCESDTEILAVFVDSKVTKKIIDSLPKLKLIVTLSTGYDHINLNAAKTKGIPVCNVPSYGESTVAEYALALMMNLSRNLFPAVKRVKEGTFDYEGLRGFDLEGKTIGIIGTGRIGRHLIRLLRGFGVEIIGYDPYPHPALQKANYFDYVTLPTLFRRADILSLHAPLTKETHHIIDKKAIQKMKPGVCIVNTARGGLIDSEALVWGLEKEIVKGAGLDVLEEENLLEDPLLLAAPHCPEHQTKIALMNNIIIDHPHTIVTPHNAFNTTEAVSRIIDTTVQNIKSWSKQTPEHMV